MTPFLQQIARRYMAECGDSLSRMAFVFPNRRAGLFFRKYLSRETKTPFFAPDTLAINDLFFAHSSLLQADKVTLHFALYKAYCSVVPNPESFDRFYFLGEMLLADFNDIDKYMADAEQVFQNISDIKQIESDLSWLSDEQKEVITHFWQGFLQHKGGEFERQFAEIWAKMFDIYAAFRTELQQRGVAYDGMIFRDVIENDSLQFDYERIVFVGFNALTTTELRLFKRCQSLDIADFYFDYQSPEISEKTKNIAAQFMAEKDRKSVM